MSVTQRREKEYWTVTKRVVDGEVVETTCCCAAPGMPRKLCAAEACHKTPCRCACHRTAAKKAAK